MKTEKQNVSLPEEVAPKEKLGSELSFVVREAYKRLRTNIEFSFTDLGRGKILGVTSPCPQEGKSFTSINFCYTLAEAGHKVILLDCDLRRPTIGEKLNLENKPGTSDVLVGRSTLEEVTRKGILQENLDFIFSGVIPPNPAELLASERMNALLQDLSEKYDYVVIDLPPVNSVSDALNVSKFLDGVIVVLKHNYTRQGEVQECIRQLRFVKAKILGFVYNGYVKPGITPSYHKSGYYKKYCRHSYGSYYYSSDKDVSSGEEKNFEENSDK